MQVFSLAFSQPEMVELSKLITLADVKLQNGQIGDCLRLLEGYWPRFLEENVPLPAGAAPSETAAAKPRPAEEKPPERSGWLNRVKDLVPDSLRFAGGANGYTLASDFGWLCRRRIYLPDVISRHIAGVRKRHYRSRLELLQHLPHEIVRIILRAVRQGDISGWMVPSGARKGVLVKEQACVSLAPPSVHNSSHGKVCAEQTTPAIPLVNFAGMDGPHAAGPHRYFSTGRCGRVSVTTLARANFPRCYRDNPANGGPSACRSGLDRQRLCTSPRSNHIPIRSPSLP